MMKELKIRLVLLIIGSILMGVGVVLATVTQMGADSVALLWEGVHIRFHISLGMANYVFTGFFLILVLLIDRKQVGIGTILSPLIQGMVMDMIIRFIPQFDSFFIRLSVMIIGIIILAIGSGISAAANLGKSPYVGFTFAINKRYNYSITFSRVILDALCLILGLLLGARLSIGPIISVFIIGPITALSFRKISEIYNFKELNAIEHDTTLRD